MPYINTVTTEKITKEKADALKESFGKLIEIIPGKSEKWLMLNFISESQMFFGGTNDAPTAMLEVDIFGKASAPALDKLTAALCQSVNAILGVSTNRIYVKYREVDHWGYNGENF